MIQCVRFKDENGMLMKPKNANTDACGKDLQTPTLSRRAAFCRFGAFVVCALVCAFTLIGAEESSALIICEGAHEGHLQGVDSQGTNIWWSFTRKIVRTDLSGRILASCCAPSHQGDLCVKGDTLYVAVNHGRFNRETMGDGFVYSYDAMTLEQKKKWKLDMPMGAGAMIDAWLDISLRF